jgi:membrane-associated protease RseP (regulator of RpoE activity)
LSNDTPTRSELPGNDPVFQPDVVRLGLPLADTPFHYAPEPRKRFQHVWWKHIALFLITLVTTTLVGEYRYLAFLSDFGRAALNLSEPSALLHGFWYSATILTILGAHEMGHYVACRWYRLDATLPYFLPLYLGFGGLQIGTLGAVIRIKEPFPTRKALFDVGVAGPIAGFVELVPALFLGMHLSNVTVSPPPADLMIIGKPLLFRMVRWLTFGPIPDGSIVNLHPMVWAAWFGMLATALNLLPFGQLDGGHLTYATLGRLSTPISLVTVASALVMTYVSLSWLLMTALMVFMLVSFGPRHPPVLNEYEPLGAARYRVALFALAMLVLCFTPFPIQF